jgi:hypothetical protein
MRLIKCIFAITQLAIAIAYWEFSTGKKLMKLKMFPYAMAISDITYVQEKYVTH